MRWHSACLPSASEPMKTWPAWRFISLRVQAIMWSAPPSPSMAASSTPMPDLRSRGKVEDRRRIRSRHTPRRRGMTTQQPSRLDLHIFEIAGLVVDADLGRRDPGGELAGLGDRLHQRGDEVAVVGRRQPFALSLVPGGLVDQHAVRCGVDILELADGAMEGDVRQRQFEMVARPRNDLFPAQPPPVPIPPLILPQPHVYPRD